MSGDKNMRTILHCDLNNFFASVECRDNLELNKYPVAVCGSEDDRHGIVLAKNQKAKDCGVKTAEAIWQARLKCPNLVIVPPHYERYCEFSKKAREIYYRYTDMIEPFGIDECWLDVSGSTGLFGDGKEIADKIREDIKRELNLTISVGVSFNKIFAKLGSDLKKPDATTVISKDNFKSVVWHLACEEMLGVGNATKNRLNGVGIYSIGEIANASGDRLYRMFGKVGYELWQNANGYNNSPVMRADFQSEAKSVGNSVTCRRNLENDEEIHRVLLSLSEEVSTRLRKSNLVAKTVTVTIKDTYFNYCEHSCTLHCASRSSDVIAKHAFSLFQKNWVWQTDVRAVGVRVSGISSESNGVQTSLFEKIPNEDNKEKLESTVDLLRQRFGKFSVQRAVLMLPVPFSRGEGEYEHSSSFPNNNK